MMISKKIFGSSCCFFVYFALLLVVDSSCQDKHEEGGGPPRKDNGHGWSYANQKDWSHQFPACKGMDRQSPININTENVIAKPEFELDFIDYDQEVEFQIKNTHHTVSAMPVSTATKPSLKLNWLDNEDHVFELNEIHFHWGDGINKGSEHEINGERAAAEMHMVHIRQGLTKADIGNVENSVVVIGVFIESDSMEHSRLESLIEEVANVNGTDTEFVTSDSNHLINLLPSQHTFYTYNGSLTTPPCFETVTWIMMSQPVYMTQERLIQLSNVETILPNVGKSKINANFRDIQPIGDRNVYCSFNTEQLVTPELRMKESFKTPTTKGRFSQAFEEFWRRIEDLRNSVRILNTSDGNTVATVTATTSSSM